MKKKVVIITLLGFALIAASAWAASRGLSTGKGDGTDQVSACQNAKAVASWGAPIGATITGYSQCSCARSIMGWTCSIDASWYKE